MRETWYYESHMEECHDIRRYVYREASPDYPVNVGVGNHGWQPSIFMSKEAARIFLRVTDVRVERLQDITFDGCISEGIIEQHGMRSELRNWYFELWDSAIKKSDINKYGWNANPFVWVYEFERVNADE